jgi:hypothetical protein
MPYVQIGKRTVKAQDLTGEHLRATTPVYPLHQTIIGIRVTAPGEGQIPNYFCVLHQDGQNIPADHTSEPLTLHDAYKEAATCMSCLTYLALPPDDRRWSILRDRLCNGDYSHVEIWTDLIKSTPTHALFNFIRLRPGASTPEQLSETGDYSAKHIVDDRREEWPDAIYVDSRVFEAEVSKRTHG